MLCKNLEVLMKISAQAGFWGTSEIQA